MAAKKTTILLVPATFTQKLVWAIFLLISLKTHQLPDMTDFLCVM
jgi:hypothetical protein